MRQFRTLLLVAAMTLCAMSAEAKVFGLGFGAGVSSTNFKIDGADVESQLGYKAGVKLGVTLPFLSITPEAWYSNSNFTLNGTTVKSSAIDVPVVVGVNILGPLKVEAGPRFTVYEKNKWGGADIGDIRSKMGYVIGLKVSVLGKVMIGARFNGQFDQPVVSSLGNSKVRSYSYALDLGFTL